MKECPHCEPSSFALKYPLFETRQFRVVCDVHPLTEGHILIMPKKHLSCAGAFSKESFSQFEKLYEKMENFLLNEYGSFSAFEHGIVGQTVFHSHIHLLPFRGGIKDIIKEKNCLRPLKSLFELRNIYKKEGKYLFIAIGKQKWVAGTNITIPGFFRKRFAKALNSPERGDWKKTRKNKKLMRDFEKDIQALIKKWQKYSSRNSF